MQSASKLIIIANYQINKEFISKNLCENKAKPKMHCNGKCHLKKQLQKEDKKENQGSNHLKEKYEVQFLNESTIAAPKHKTTSTTSIPDYLMAESNRHLSAIFHPPQA